MILFPSFTILNHTASITDNTKSTTKPFSTKAMGGIKKSDIRWKLIAFCTTSDIFREYRRIPYVGGPIQQWPGNDEFWAYQISMRISSQQTVLSDDELKCLVILLRCSNNQYLISTIIYSLLLHLDLFYRHHTNSKRWLIADQM